MVAKNDLRLLLRRESRFEVLLTHHPVFFNSDGRGFVDLLCLYLCRLAL